MMDSWLPNRLHVILVSTTMNIPTPGMAFCICSLGLGGKIRETWMNAAISMATNSPLMILKGILNMTFWMTSDGEQ